MRLGTIAIAVGVLSIVWCAYVGVSGSAIVHDSTGQAASAVVTDDHVAKGLWHFPGRIYFGIPDRDGVIEVRCRDGSKAQAGYVTSGMHTWVTVVASKPCRLVENL